MKTKFVPALCAALMAATPLFGEPVFEKELNQLKEQRDKAISAAIEPINRRYQTSLPCSCERPPKAMT